MLPAPAIKRPQNTLSLSHRAPHHRSNSACLFSLPCWRPCFASTRSPLSLSGSTRESASRLPDSTGTTLRGFCGVAKPTCLSTIFFFTFGCASEGANFLFERFRFCLRLPQSQSSTYWGAVSLTHELV